MKGFLAGVILTILAEGVAAVAIMINILIPQNLNSNLFPKARKYGIIEA